MGQNKSEECRFLRVSSKRETARIRRRYLGQAAGSAVGAGLGYALAFFIGALATQATQSAAVITLLVMFTLGTPVGFSIGLGLCVGKGSQLHRMAGAGIFGAVVSSASYLGFVRFGLSPDLEHIPIYVITGMCLGLGVGLGAGLRGRWHQRLGGTMVGGLLAMGIGLALGGLPWDPPVALISGLVLGTLTGLGLLVTAVDEREIAGG